MDSFSDVNNRARLVQYILFVLIIKNHMYQVALRIHHS